MGRIGYARVSTVEQNEGRQLVAFENEGTFERVFLDKLSGKNTDRPALQEMLSFVREGDIVEVESFSRLARNTRDLLSIVEELNTKGVALVSRKEALDTSTPQGKFMLTIFGAMAELEREQILQRQKEGIALAKEKGVYRGRKEIEAPRKSEEIFQLVEEGRITALRAMELLGLKRGTYYKLYNEYKEGKKA